MASLANPLLLALGTALMFEEATGGLRSELLRQSVVHQASCHGAQKGEDQVREYNVLLRRS